MNDWIMELNERSKDDRAIIVGSEVRALVAELATLRARSERLEAQLLAPNPGTIEAGRLGCKGPILDNGHGKGHHGGYLFEGRYVFVINGECPVHAARAALADEWKEGA